MTAVNGRVAPWLKTRLNAAGKTIPFWLLQCGLAASEMTAWRDLGSSGTQNPFKAGVAGPGGLAP